MKYDTILYPFDSRWIDIQNQKVHYVDEGDGQIILFSHAAIGSSYMYRRFIQILSRTYRCIALDYPGFGLSSNGTHYVYGVVSQSRVLRQFIQQLQLKDIIALGHDTGGPSLFKVAADHPDLFKGLILTDTIIFPTSEYVKIHTMLSVLGSGVVQALNGWTNFLMKLTINKGVATRKLGRQEKIPYYEMSNTSAKRKRIIKVLVSLRDNPEFMKRVKEGFENELNEKPVLLIYGEKDPVNELGVPDRIHAMLKNSELFHIRKEGHFPHEGQPERMSEIIHQWIQKLN